MSDLTHKFTKKRTNSDFLSCDTAALLSKFKMPYFTTLNPKKLRCYVKLKKKENAIICKRTLLANNGFTKSFQARVVISLTLSQLV